MNIDDVASGSVVWFYWRLTRPNVVCSDWKRT